MGLLQPASNSLWETRSRLDPSIRPQLPRPRRSLDKASGIWLDPSQPPPPARPTFGFPSPVLGLLTAFGLTFRLIWATIVLPFRMIVWVFALLGRIVALVVGFCLMVMGAALLPSPLFLLGLPIFALGLVMTLRSVE